jgi:hypothetical protein
MPSISLSSLLTLNASGAANTGTATDEAELSASVGSNFSSVTLTLTASLVTIPGIITGSILKALRVRNTGANAATLDLVNQAGASSQLDIAAGGQVEFFNITTGTAANKAVASTWTLSSASGTTVYVAWVV